MMLIAAFAVPWCLGALIVALPAGRRAGKLFTAGAGWFAGQTLLSLVLYAILKLGFKLDAESAGLVLAAMVVAVVWIGSRVFLSSDSSAKRPSADGAADAAPVGAAHSNNALSNALSSGIPRWHAALLALIGIALLAKLAILTIPHACVPVRGDDAISIWLYKAKVIAGLGAYPNDPVHPFFHAGSNPRYPVFLPLQAAFPALVTGEWHERQATWPWLLAWINLVLMIAGAVRRWTSPLAAWGTAYFVAAMPLILIHVYRPGYADLPLAANLCGAIACVFAWRRSGEARMLLLALLLGLGAALMKREGPPVVGVAAAALMVPSWRHVSALTAAARWIGLAAVLLAVFLVAEMVDLRDVGENVADAAVDPAVLPILWRHAFEWASFHIAFWLLLPATAVLTLRRDLPDRWPAILLASGLLAQVVCIFLLTPQAHFAHNNQTPSRLFMQVMPAILVACVIALSPLFAARSQINPQLPDSPGVPG